MDSARTARSDRRNRSRAKKEIAAGPPPPVPVRVGTVELRTVPVQITAIGNVEAYSTVSIKPLVSGTLESIHFEEGQDVHKGQLLFKIDRRPFEAALAEATANLARDKATAANARVEAGRYAQVLRYRSHIVPVANALRQMLQRPGCIEATA